MRKGKKAESQKSKSNLKVLIVDDDNTSAQTIARSLNTAVPDVDVQSQFVGTIAEMESALTANTENYDLVILDYRLTEDEEVNGIPIQNLLKEIHGRESNTQVFVYSNFALEKIERPLEGGIKFFPKFPISDNPSDRLESEIRSVLLRKQEQIQSLTDLILPVASTIVVVNTGLVNMFKQDPELLRKIDPILFEEIVAELFVKEGYEIVLTPPRADGGKDIYVYKTDPLTRTKFLVECKRYNPPLKVDVSIARQLHGVVQQEQATGGIIVTTSYFTKPAKEFARKVPFQLFLTDFDDLSQWLKRIT